MDTHLHCQKLDVYRAALELDITCDAIVQRIPRGKKHLSDQLDRATSSVVLNVAEGAGEFSAKEKARFYRMALRSATESAAVLDLAESCLDGQCATDLAVARGLLYRIVSMLTKLVKRMSG